MTCTPKSMGVQLGQRGTGCSTRTLASAGSNYSQTTKNPKMTRKREAQFLLPPPHTHTGAGAIHNDLYLKNASYQRTSPPSLKTQKLPPYPPTKLYQDPPTPYPLPLCALYHNIDSPVDHRYILRKSQEMR